MSIDNNTLNSINAESDVLDSVELSQERVSLQWKDIKVTTKAGRELLKGVSGMAVPGEVVALMGASGAGKTTLLNTLLQRNLHGLSVEGEILVNGQNVGKGVTSVSAYVQQEDLFVGTLTVREHLEIQARMRLPASTSRINRKKRVEEVMREMLLEKSQNSRIGIPGIVKGISGGEMKRLAFASEMINNPPIIFCDEPTTGLDSHMALQVVKTLESMAADQGKSIICTIHQPSSEVFELFDRVVFLAQGRIAFHGATDEAIYHFANCGHFIPDHTNPADFYIDILAINPSSADDSKKRANEICDKFLKSEYNLRMESMMDVARQKKQLHSHVGANYFGILIGLLRRYAVDNFRNPAILRAKFIQKIFMGLFMGFLYFGTDNDQDGVTNYKGALFYYCAELTYATIFGIQAFMPGDFPIVVREYDDRIYPVSAYYIAKVLSFIPIFSLDGVIMVTISYFIVGFKASISRFLHTVATAVFVELNVAALGVAVCALSPSYAVAVTISGPILTVFSLTGGLFTNTKKMPAWIQWVQYLSWFRYGYESFIINIFSDSAFDNISCSRLGNANVTNCEKTGQQVIDNLNFDPKNLYFNWIAMLFCTIVIYIIGYMGIVRRVIWHK